MNYDLNKRIDQMSNQELFLSLSKSDEIELNGSRENSQNVVDQINLELYIRASGLRNGL